MALKLLDEAAQMTEAERLFLFRRATAAVGSSHVDDVAEAIECVRACQADLFGRQGVTVCGLCDPRLADAPMPSRAVVSRWLRCQPQGRYPTLHGLLKPFGGRWSDLKAMVTSSPRADFYARTVSRWGVRLQRAGLVAGIRKWSRSESFDPTLRQMSFLEFARTELRRAQADPEVLAVEALAAGEVEPEYAAACNIYIDRFGSWAHALAEAGLLEAVAFDDYLQLMSRHKTYCRDDALEAVRGAWAYAQRHGEERLMNRHYGLARRERLYECWKRGEVCFVPGAVTVRKLVGGPAQAVMAAGLGDAEGLRQSIIDRGVPISPAFARAHVWAATVYLGAHRPAGLRRSEYLALRKRLTTVLGEPVPTAKTIVAHLIDEGWSWEAAMFAAESEEPDSELLGRFLARLREALGDERSADPTSAYPVDADPALTDVGSEVGGGPAATTGGVVRGPLSLAGFDDLFGARRGWGL